MAGRQLKTAKPGAELVLRGKGVRCPSAEARQQVSPHGIEHRLHVERAGGRDDHRLVLGQDNAELPEALREGTLSVEQLSGVTHEDCAAFSRDLSTVLDVEDLVPGAEYTLEASSPGLDRKLAKPEDFARFKGNLVKIQTFEPIKNNHHWQGRLTGIEGENITLDLGAIKQNSKSRKTGVNTVEIALSNVEKAQLIPEI